MIVFKLGDVLKEKGISQRELARRLLVRPNTINDLVNNNTKMISKELLNGICRELNCTVADLIEYVPDNDAEGS